MSTLATVSFGPVTGTVDSLNVPHLRVIAQRLALDISGPYIRKDDLQQLIRDKLLTFPSCFSCAGRCDPALHLFEVNLADAHPVNNAPHSANHVVVADELMDTNQPGTAQLPPRDLFSVNSVPFDNIALVTSSADFISDFGNTGQPLDQVVGAPPPNNVSRMLADSAAQLRNSGGIALSVPSTMPPPSAQLFQGQHVAHSSNLQQIWHPLAQPRLPPIPANAQFHSVPQIPTLPQFSLPPANSSMQTTDSASILQLLLAQQNSQQQWQQSLQQRMDDSAQQNRIAQDAFLQSLQGLAQMNIGSKPAPHSSGLLSPFGSVLPALTPPTQQGRARLVAIPNRRNAQRMGINMAPLQELDGDYTQCDLTRLKRKLVSGRFSSGSNGVVKEERWPHQCLNKNAVQSVPKEVGEMTFPMFCAGMFGKVLTETPSDIIDPCAENKLLFASRICDLAFNLPWKHIIEVIACFFESVEQAQQRWDNWPEIDSWLIHQERLISVLPSNSQLSTPHHQSAHNQPPPFAAPPKKARFDDVLGIPCWWMRNENLCVLFNNGSCKLPGDHLVQDNNLHHICAACCKGGKGRITAHGAHNCPNKPRSGNFSHLFR